MQRTLCTYLPSAATQVPLCRSNGGPAWIWAPAVRATRRLSHEEASSYTRRVSDALAVAVDCYAGARGDETPRRFTRGDQLVEILAVVDQWRAPDHRYFRVRTAGETYTLREDVTSGGWELTEFDRYRRVVALVAGLRDDDVTLGVVLHVAPAAIEERRIHRERTVLCPLGPSARCRHLND